MTDNTLKPILYFKQNCPFCLKVRLFLLEAGLNEDVEIREFVSGSPAEEDIRAELSPHLDKVSFPAARIEPGRYIAESDDIVAFLAAKAGREPASMPAFTNYVEGPLKLVMNLWKENIELKAAAA
ncbi:glutathione S-transferase [Rhizobium anhuiense]|uniref:glutathione S-transferase N-terminal domain-containing protein n=1 Tax=Rhizobium anhuiense TaxID=1184720 RepID=UPI000BEAD131|nr:glutathione S-transferase N-terminal domain-containing protein [Rhizobium anhuiense]NKM56026.1 glutathione S-transferase domain-containing protein [Rhizobium anhuiense]PDS64054.1 glutathione S-transferase [Rhizobium anhuiense]